ncbi:hypothetical protein G5714_000523 [Onychostoma macrolepis]|uniref:Uncharacterized protein n=1 Tax=Onychostoma macrolepis TaxID=369639 RepID=A0A7J6DGK8_9TELE|nr:hypothetical protein G5714_000523 [Onychostoma macrolepis]
MQDLWPSEDLIGSTQERQLRVILVRVRSSPQNSRGREGTRGDMKWNMSPLVVLFIIIGLLGPTCENLNNLTDSAVSHHAPPPDQRVNRTQLNDRALEYWPVANRTEIKIFRRGPLVISRKYWYPVLEIAIKKAPPISPAITSATTSTKSFSSSPATPTTMLPTSSFPETAQTTTSGPSTTKTKYNFMVYSGTWNNKSSNNNYSAPNRGNGNTSAYTNSSYNRGSDNQ